jgi:choline dehydrogenase-like flavoprotein
MLQTEIVVIGSGPGGAITAATLTKAKRDVLLIENGPHFNLNSCTPYSIEEIEQKYRGGGITPTFGNPIISYVEGCCVGGGSEINSGLYHRIPEETLKKWGNKFKLKNIGEKDLTPLYKEIEKNICISYLSKEAPMASIKLIDGARRLGWKSMEVPRWIKYTSGTDETKQSMTETYIPRFLNDGGALLPNTKVIKIIKQGKEWLLIGKKTTTSEQVTIQCRYLFVCGGAIQTPALLRRSSIKRNIGNSLQTHPTIKVIAKFPEKVNCEEMGVPTHQVKEFAPDFSFGCSISSKSTLALAMLDNAEYMQEVEKNWGKMAMYYAMIVPAGKGVIRNLPFFNDPFVKYSLKECDLELLAKALKKICLLLFEAGAESIYPSIRGFGVLKGVGDINQIPRLLPRDKANIMTIHLMSSCPMGEDEKICATDSFGKVYGYDNLYINDGSLLCSAPGVNPQGSIMVIALRNVNQFLENHV